MLSDQLREKRIELFHERQIASLMRKDASHEAVVDAASLIQDKRLPRFAVEFRLDEERGYVPGRWTPASGLGDALENYVRLLCEMEKVRFRHSVLDGLTQEHRTAFDAVVAAAHNLERLGWPVNWEQNVQTILEPTELGIRDGKLVSRFSAPPEVVTLGDELLLLGTVTFYRQRRYVDGAVTPFKSCVLSTVNKFHFENIPLRHRRIGDELPARFRYSSEWMPDKSGKSYRIAV